MKAAYLGTASLLALIGVGSCCFLLGAEARARYGADRFVQMIERSQGVVAGQTRVIPECGCTVRYDGTQVRGRHYLVDIERLD